MNLENFANRTLELLGDIAAKLRDSAALASERVANPNDSFCDYVPLIADAANAVFEARIPYAMPFREISFQTSSVASWRIDFLYQGTVVKTFNGAMWSSVVLSDVFSNFYCRPKFIVYADTVRITLSNPVASNAAIYSTK